MIDWWRNFYGNFGGGGSSFGPGGGTFPPANPNSFQGLPDPNAWRPPSSEMDILNRTDWPMVRLMPGMDQGMAVNPDLYRELPRSNQVIYDPSEMSRFGVAWNQMYPGTPTGGADRNVLTADERNMMGISDANEPDIVAGVEPTPFPFTAGGGFLPPHQAMDVPQLPPNDQGMYYPPNIPHQGVDFPTGMNVPHQAMDFGLPWDQPDIGYDLPPSPDFPFTNYYPPDTGTATIMSPTGGADTRFYDPGTYTPFTDFGGGGLSNPAPNEGMTADPTWSFNEFNPVEGYNPYDYDPGQGFFDTSGEMQAPPGGSFQGTPGGFDFTAPSGELINPFLQDIPTDFVSDPGAAPAPAYAYQYGGGQAAPPSQITPNTYAPTATSYPGTGDPTNPLTINPSDPNNNLTRGGVGMPLYPTKGDVFPQPSLMDELGRPTDWSGAGNFIKDAFGNLVDATGKVLISAADLASKFGGSIANATRNLANNIMNDPRNTTPADLRNIGYHTDYGGTGVTEPFATSGPTTGAFDIGAYGVGGHGGSYFHGGATAGSRHPAGPLPGGGGGGFGGGSRANAAALGGGGWQTRLQYVLRNIAQGGRGLKYPAPALSNAYNTYEYRKLLESKLGISPTAPRTSAHTPGAAADFAREVQERGYLFPGHPDLPLEGPRGFAKQGIKELGMGPQTPSGPQGHKIAQTQPV